MLLEKIIDDKRAEVARRKAAQPLEDIARDLPPSDRSLEKALEVSGTRFIFECKRASPSNGTIRHDYDAAKLAQTLSTHADAISVLTDEKYFGGNLEDLRSVRNSVDLPVMRKDFIVDTYQVYESRANGADAILLILAALTDAEFAECFAAAQALNLDTVAEIHDEPELRRAINLGARIIGINSRDLRTMKVDLETVSRLAPLIPRDKLVIAESGVGSHDDVRMVSPSVDAFLIGTSVMKCEDVERAAREIVYGNVKVCGLTRTEDAALSERLGATFGGLIFAEKSPRAINMDQAAKIQRAARLNWVGVFVDETPESVAEAAQKLELTAVQLHGDEDRDYIETLSPMLPHGCETWKALRVRNRPPCETELNATRILLDSFSEGSRGGTGMAFDWSLIEGMDLSSFVLSGGLSPANASQADMLGAYALDVNSGVERSPGVKDETLLANFFAALRNIGRGSTS